MPLAYSVDSRTVYYRLFGSNRNPCLGFSREYKVRARIKSVVFRLVSLYSTLPKKVGCPGELKITWMESHHHFEGEEFEGRAELVAFYAW